MVATSTCSSRSLAFAAGLALLLAPGLGRAQTDEIQVYDAEIAEPGQVTLTVHVNYTPAGRTTPDFPGGIIPNRTVNTVTEWAYGVTDWWELGAYAPFILSVDGTGRTWLEGAKLRTLFVSPHAADRPLFYGLNFEFSYNRPQWASQPWELEVRPIVGVHLDAWQLVFNPIVDLSGFRQPTAEFAPSLRGAYTWSKRWAGGVELYSSFGAIGRFAPLVQEQHQVFLVLDHSSPSVDLEVGVGLGLTTPGSDALVLKAIISPHLGAAISGERAEPR